MRKCVQSFKLAAVAMCCIASSAFAGVTITGTRIVFPANQQSATIQLNNSSEKPALVQAWLDNGDPTVIPEAGQIPFILTPPLTRIEPKKGQMIRLLSKGVESLPQDRESLYWFNLLDIPATAQEDEKAEANKLQVSIRSRIKLFYRPEKLKMSQDKAFTAVKLSYDVAKKQVNVTNPSPYYINFENVELKNGKDSFTYAEPLMVAPFATETFDPKIKFKPTQATYLLINDYGGSQSFNASLVDGTVTPTTVAPVEAEKVPTEAAPVDTVATVETAVAGE